ncbi:MAG: RluA family pseudouridine synthase [Desulfuromonadaceae bacterium]|nr:RluA family pseudouridine synthase [Desulfuromonadaceae bacterium]
MARHGQFFFERGRSPERLDRFLADCLPETTRSQLKRLIDENHVLVDGGYAKAGEKLRGGETILVDLPAPVSCGLQPEAIPLPILHEDNNLIVIDKPAGMVVHPAPGHHGGTLVNALLHHCGDLSGIGGELRPGIVHRLDKDTSGVLVATKNETAHNALAAQFKEHTVHRRYVALIQGVPAENEGIVDKPIGRHPTERKKMALVVKAGRRAVTRWKVLARFPEDRLALVELRLETGRTHQIRVHLAGIGFPVAGDPVYGHKGWLKQLPDRCLRQLLLDLNRQALHAGTLGFIHPDSGRYMEFSSPPPEDMMEILRYLWDKYHLEPSRLPRLFDKTEGGKGSLEKCN